MPRMRSRRRQLRRGDDDVPQGQGLDPNATKADDHGTTPPKSEPVMTDVVATTTVGAPPPRSQPAAPAPTTTTTTAAAAGPEDSLDTQELATGYTGHEAIVAGARTVDELQEEIESLEAVVDRLDGDKRALRMRLNAIEYFREFRVGDCKKWLAANYEFDRKDSAELLAGIFENYLLQNDRLEPLPHQIMIKNSARAQSRRERLISSRAGLAQRRERLVATAQHATPVPRQRSPAPTKSSPDAANHNGDVGAYGQFLYLRPEEIDRFYAGRHWARLIDQGPKIEPTAKTPDVEELVRFQDEFIRANAFAIWERSAWFPIKQENGKTEDEIRALARLFNRRKRRQSQLKERIERLHQELKGQWEKAVLEQSVFGAKWVRIIMRRPKLWIPREDEDLTAQMHELHTLEPERAFDFATALTRSVR